MDSESEIIASLPSPDPNVDLEKVSVETAEKEEQDVASSFNSNPIEKPSQDVENSVNSSATVNNGKSKQLLSDEWIAELLSVRSEHSDAEMESGDLKKIQSQKRKSSISSEALATIEAEETENGTELKPSPNQNNCTNGPTFVLDKKGYRDESDSSIDDESDSSSTTGANSDSSGSSLEFMNKSNKTNGIRKPPPCIKTRGELGMEDLPPIEELSISVLEKESELIGKVHSIVEQLVVVRAIKGLAPIDLDSVLFLSHSRPLGKVFDVFGPVTEPFYSVRFNGEEDIKAKLIKIGMDVYYAPGRSDVTKFVFVDQLKSQKGSDASWTHNNEPPDDFLDFSNDEAEREAKKKRQKKKRGRENDEGVGKRETTTPDISIIKESPRLSNNTRYQGSSSFTKQPFLIRNNLSSLMGSPIRLYTAQAPQVNNYILAQPRMPALFTSPIPQPIDQQLNFYNRQQQRPQLQQQYGQMAQQERPLQQFGQHTQQQFGQHTQQQKPSHQFGHQQQQQQMPLQHFGQQPYGQMANNMMQQNQQRPMQHQFGQMSNPRLFSPAPAMGSGNYHQQNYIQSPAVVPMSFIRSPPPMNSPQPTLYFTAQPNLVQAQPLVLSPQQQQGRLICVPSPQMGGNVPPPNVPLSIQVPPNYINSPPPLTPTMPVFTSPPAMFYNPQFRFQNNHV